MKNKRRIKLLKKMKTISCITACIGLFGMIGSAGGLDLAGSNIYSVLLCLAASLFIFVCSFIFMKHCSDEIERIISRLIKSRTACKSPKNVYRQHNIA